MGHNCAVAALAGVGIEDLARIGVRPSGRTATGDQALGEHRPYAAVRNGHLVLASRDPGLLELADKFAADLGAPLVGVILASTIDHYVLRFRDGDTVRERVVAEGATVSQMGEPRPEEAALDDEEHTEDGILAVLERATDVTLDDAWMELELHELDAALPGEEGTAYDDPMEYVDVNDPRFVPVSSVFRSVKAAEIGLVVGIVLEALVGVAALTTDGSVGPPVLHGLFLLIAVLTRVAGMMDVARLGFTALEAAILLVALGVTAARGGANLPVVVGFAGYLVVLIGVLVWHVSRVLALRRALVR